MVTQSATSALVRLATASLVNLSSGDMRVKELLLESRIHGACVALLKTKVRIASKSRATLSDFEVSVSNGVYTLDTRCASDVAGDGSADACTQSLVEPHKVEVPSREVLPRWRSLLPRRRADGPCLFSSGFHRLAAFFPCRDIGLSFLPALFRRTTVPSTWVLKSYLTPSSESLDRWRTTKRHDKTS